jgi:4'-phosphopantetheinyl transferase
MDTLPQNRSGINSLSPEPGIIIWYCKIQDAIGSILSSGLDKNFRSVLNTNFQKTDFPGRFFSDLEIHTINSFKALKKQVEWMSGRVLIKQMLRHFFFKTAPLDHITLSYLDQGAPVVTDHPDIPISLSHSHDYAVAACCLDKRQTIGIDIEKIAAMPDHFFMRTAFTQNEMDHLTKLTGPAPVFKNWTIKEAYLKYIKKGLNESLHRVEIIDDEIRHNGGKINVDVFSTHIDGYVLSLVSKPLSSGSNTYPTDRLLMK